MVATPVRVRQQTRLPKLNAGDRLDQETFHARYEAMPASVRAQLIGGNVFMSSPMKKPHGKFNVLLSRWLGEYEEATPGTEALAGATEILGSDSEPEADGCLLIQPEYGGQTRENDKGFIEGAPEWIAEIADTTESVDLRSKKRDFERAGVREYLVVALRARKVHFFRRRRGKLKEATAGSDGIYRSAVFPGLWLDPAALLSRDSKRLMAVLRLGLVSPEHATFVAALAAKKPVGK
jgi:Uma2 family endonuclease